MAEKYFCFFENIRTAIKKLPRDQQLAFREAIENYVFDGVEPSDPVFAALLQILKPSLDKKGRGGQAGNKNAQKSANNSNKTNKNESKRIETNKNESNESGHETLNTKHQTLNTKGVPPTPKTNIFSPPTWTRFWHMPNNKPNWLAWVAFPVRRMWRNSFGPITSPRDGESPTMPKHRFGTGGPRCGCGHGALGRDEMPRRPRW